jgi:hypothetical protein
VTALFLEVPSDGFFEDLRDDFEVDLVDDLADGLADNLGANLVIAFLASAADTFSLGLSQGRAGFRRGVEGRSRARCVI